MAECAFSQVLFGLVKNGTLGEIEVAIKSGANINYKDIYGETVLMEAAGSANSDIISILLEAGANIDYITDGGFTPLMIASQYSENLKNLEILLHSGADAKLRTDDGKTVFDFAKENENIKGTDVYWELNNKRY